MQGIESWLLPHQQISDLFQDATVPKGTWRIMEFRDAELPQAQRKWKETSDSCAFSRLFKTSSVFLEHVSRNRKNHGLGVGW